MPPALDRYAKQILFASLGEQGQAKLREAKVLLCGCGALGSVLADTLTRAGVGELRIVDRDFVELSNLQRQVLYDEADVESRLPKAIAAAEKLRRINRNVAIEPIVADIDHENILGFAAGRDLILDGSDNFEVRFLINDAALETGIPWIYAGVIGSHGQTMAVFPGRTACLRCLIEDVPPPGTTETCDTAGVLGPAVNVIASLEAVDAIKILSGQPQLVEPVLTIVDVWDGTFRRLNVGDLRDRGDCPACKGGGREWLSGARGSQSTVLCGRNAVQVAPQHKGRISLDELAGRLRGQGRVETNPFLLRFSLVEPAFEITVFGDGRAIVQGTEDVAAARAIYARYIGA
ncbi:MAG: ThiF family adenylyltransferase [Planctomycetales bacterium]